MEEKKCGVFTDELHKQNRTQKEILEKIDKIEKQQTKNNLTDKFTTNDKTLLKKKLFDSWNEIYFTELEKKRKENKIKTEKEINKSGYVYYSIQYTFLFIDKTQFTSIYNKTNFINSILKDNNYSKEKIIIASDWLEDNYMKLFKQYEKKCTEYEISTDEQWKLDNLEQSNLNFKISLNESSKKITIRNTLIVITVILATIAILCLGWVFKGIAIIILAIILMCGKSK